MSRDGNTIYKTLCIKLKKWTDKQLKVSLDSKKSAKELTLVERGRESRRVTAEHK